MAHPGKEYIPTLEHRAHVRALAMCGRNQNDIALSLSIDPGTLAIHFEDELKTNVLFLESTASERMMQALKSEDDRVAVDAAKFLLRMKCKWKEDKSVDADAQQSIFDAIVQAAAAQLLAKKEKENEY